MATADRRYVEDETIVLPALPKGPMSIGDLCDCHESVSAGFNLFGEVLPSKHVRVDRVQEQQSTLTHVKGTKDKHETLQVRGELSLELLTVSGQTDSGKDVSIGLSLSEEELQCSYELSAFVVRALPSAKEAVDPVVREKLLKGEIKATHVVVREVLGARTDVSIKIKETKKSTKADLKSYFLRKLAMGPITASTKSTLGMLDTCYSSDLEKTIKVESQPPVSLQPTSIKDMFEVIQGVGDVIKQHSHSSFKSADNGNVYGVPIRYVLVPIHEFVDTKALRLYIRLNDNVLQDLTALLYFLKDVQLYPYLSKRILQAHPSLKSLLLNLDNPLTQEISNREQEMKTIAEESVEKLRKKLSEYKMMEATQADLLAVANEIHAMLSFEKVLAEAQEYARRASSEALSFISPNLEDAQEVTLFINESDLQEWFQPSKRIKLRLKTGCGTDFSISATTLTLFELCPKLNQLEVELGVALPCMSRNEYSLTLKIGGREHVYLGSEIRNVVRALLLVTEQEKPLAARFLTIYASSNRIQLPFKENLQELASLINVLKEVQAVRIVESGLETREICQTKSGPKWNFVVSLEALDSVTQSVKRFKYLRHILQQHNKCEWTFGKFGIETYSEYSNAPLLFIFWEGSLVGQCMDNLDLLILQEVIKDEESVERLLPLLNPTIENLQNNCFIPEKAQFALKVHQILGMEMRAEEVKVSIGNLFGFQIQEPDFKKLVVRSLIRSLLLSDSHGLLSSVGSILALESETLKTKLLELGWVISPKTSGLKAPVNVQAEKLRAILQSFLESQDPSFMRIQGNCKSLQGCSESGHAELAETFIKAIVSEPTLPIYLKTQFGLWKDMQLPAKIDSVVEKVKAYLDSTSGKKYELTLQVMTFLEIENPVSQSDFVANFLLPSCLSAVSICGTVYPSAVGSLNLLPQLADYYENLEVLAMTSIHPTAYSLVKLFDDLVELRDKDGFSKFFRKLSVVELTEEQKYSLCYGSTRMSYALELNIAAEGLLNIVNWLPQHLQDQVSSLGKMNDCFECPDSFTSLDQILSAFGNIIAVNIIPPKFAKALPQTLIENQDIMGVFREADALTYWNAEGMYFTQAWDIGTIENAKTRLSDWRSSLSLTPLPKSKILVELDLEISEENSTEAINMEDVTVVEPPSPPSRIWTQLMGPAATHISPLDFLKLTDIPPDPEPTDDVSEGYIQRILPLVVQRVKMWGVHTLSPVYLSSLLRQKPLTITPLPDRNSNSFAGPPKLKFPTRNSSSVAASISAGVGGPGLRPPGKPISKLDILACLYACCDKLVFQDLIRVVSQFPVALPFIIPNIKRPDNQPEFVCLASELRNIRSKWEVSPGTVVQNHLFSSPFKMVVALRVGSQKQGQPGKSSILNQVLASRDVFSSQGDPGAEHGKPLTLDGTVEICILSQEIASGSLWNEALRSHYASGKDQVLLLANLHGEALQFPQTLEVLKSFASSFLVFLMPMSCGELEDSSSKLVQALDCGSASPDWSCRFFYALVDPTEDCIGVLPLDKQINTGRIASDSTSLVTRSLLCEAINISNCLTPAGIPSFKDQTPFDRVKFSPALTHTESQVLVNIVADVGSLVVKSSLKLQKINSKCADFGNAVLNEWNSNELLRQVINKLIKILMLPIEQRLWAIAHLDSEISRITATTSAQSLLRIMALNEQKCRVFNLENCQQSLQEKHTLETQISSEFEELDRITLGMEHLYRELARVYQYFQSLDPGSFTNKVILRVPSLVAETLIQGNAIEILDGDAMDVCGPWFNAICHSICQRHPDLKVFVLSIIGLQSSGKSTLLNALFACKFAVSVGRCTRGLFMRLLFLREDLANELGVDAIVVLDTEGLGAPEKLNDPLSDQKDRLLATFAMSVSNLTLINVLGESLGDLTDILQIVIVTMARLEQAQISPDILMVQHLSERDGSKVMQGAKEFSSALDAAVNLTSNQDMDIGIQNSHSLQRLQSRVKSGQILNQFPPFKNGATVNAPPSQQYHESISKLYSAILRSCNDTKSPQKFHQWHDVIQGYWDAVSSQDFALRFKNIREIQDFIDRGKSIQRVKVAIDDAFKAHRDLLEIKLRENMHKQELTNASLKLDIEKIVEFIPHSCPESCATCINALQLQDQLFDQLRGHSSEQETQSTLLRYTQRHRNEVLKQLTQKIDALEIERGYVGDFDKIIENALRKELSLKDRNKTLSDTELQKIATGIWGNVKQEVSQKCLVSPASQRILSEIDVEYSGVGFIRRDVEGEASIDFRSVDAIQRSKFFSFFSSKKLEPQLVTELQDGLKKRASAVLQDHKSFEAGMIRCLRNDVNSFLGQLQKAYRFTLNSSFKWKAHVFALIHFKREATEIDKNWNETNNPSWILEKKKELYMKEIKIRLQHGYGLEAEGRVVGAFLLKAVRKLGQDRGDKAHERHVKDHDWLTGSENVRLRYFSELAIQVERGDNVDAIDHFFNPNEQINKWFSREVDSICKDKGVEKFQETVKAEIKSLLQDIRNKNSFDEILKEVLTYLLRAGISDYVPKFETSGNFLIFQENIINTLREGESGLVEKVIISDPSDSSTVRSLLGCTEPCFWCAALCWGAYGHHEDEGETKRHHTCHQPAGLRGVSNKQTSELVQTTCSCKPDEYTVFWFERPEGISWPRAKREYFQHWMFSEHHKTEFSGMMKWFFLKLNDNIAAALFKKPASQNSLRAQGFFSLPGIAHMINTIKESFKGH